MPPKSDAFPYRRGSTASEDDFFDIPDETCLALVKRQLRHIRTWVALAVFALLVMWLRRAPAAPPRPRSHINYDAVDWSRFAYTQYATSETYLCNCVMVFEALQRLGSRADRILYYPQDWDLIIDSPEDRVSQLLLMAKNEYNVQVVPVKIEGVNLDRTGSKQSWDMSRAKLFAFSETQYERVIHLDSDMILLQKLDELFFLPPAIVAMPRAYWLLPDQMLSSQVVVIEPSYREYNALNDAVKAAMSGQVQLGQSKNRYDMDLLNDRYRDNALVLPHRKYNLITGEFRTKDHRNYMGNEHEEWDPDRALAEAKFVHFSDWPLPKPWVMWPQKELAEMQPKCDNNPGTPEESGCRDREVWKKIYDDFRHRRKDVCKLLSFPAPV